MNISARFVNAFGTAMLVMLFLFACAEVASAEEDGTYLGELGGSEYDPESTENEYGLYGSEYSSESINNDYGVYGSEHSIDSPNNEYSTGRIRLYAD